MRSWAALSLLAVIGSTLPATPLMTLSAGVEAQMEAAAVEPNSEVGRIADMWGIGEEEARSQMAIQDSLDGIPFAKLDSGFAEVRTDPGAQFEITYLSTSSSLDGVLAEFSRLGIDHLVTLQKVPFSHAELSEAHAVVTSGESLGMATSWPDATTGRIIVAMEDPVLESQRKEVNGRSQVPIAWLESINVEPTVEGGRAGNFCTGGFTVVDSTGDRGMTTAGHCGNTNWIYNGLGTYYNDGREQFSPGSAGSGWVIGV